MPDPMARWRGKYSTEEQAREFIADSGGLSMLWILGMIEAGVWSEPDAPIIGDVGIVRVLGENGPEEVGAIFSGKRWVMRAPRGLYSASVPHVMIWRM